MRSNELLSSVPLFRGQFIRQTIYKALYMREVLRYWLLSGRSNFPTIDSCPFHLPSYLVRKPLPLIPFRFSTGPGRFSSIRGKLAAGIRSPISDHRFCRCKVFSFLESAGGLRLVKDPGHSHHGCIAQQCPSHRYAPLNLTGFYGPFYGRLKPPSISILTGTLDLCQGGTTKSSATISRRHAISGAFLGRVRNSASPIRTTPVAKSH